MFAALFENTEIPDDAVLQTNSAFKRALFPFLSERSCTHINNKNSTLTHSERAVFFGASNVQVLFWGQLHNTDDLCDKLELSNRSGLNTAQLVTLAWDKWGKNFPNHFVGNFSIALFFSDANRVILVRDAVGIRPLFYCRDGSGLLCATTPKAILLAAKTPLAKNKHWVMRFLVSTFAVADPKETAYIGLSKVTPGHIVVIENGQVISDTKWKHWRNAPITADQRDQKWVTQHQALVSQAVARCADTQIIGTETTAGIDSSSIISVLCEQLEPDHVDRIVCFGDADTQTTLDLIQELSTTKGGLETHITRADRDGVKDWTDVYRDNLKIMGYPISHANYVPSETLQLHNRTRDMRVMLSGFGGDEVVTSFAKPYVKELIDQRKWRILCNIQRGNIATKCLRMMKRIWADLVEKIQNPHRKVSEETDATLFKPKAIQDYNAHDLIAGIDASANSYRTINDEVIHHGLGGANMANRLECHTIFGNAYGIEYRWPLLDEHLIQNYLDTPSIEKYGPDGTTRYLHKRAMDTIVPDSINWRPTKDLGAHFQSDTYDQAVLTHMIDETQNTLDTLHPDLLEFVDPTRIQQLINEFSKTRPPREAFESYQEVFTNLTILNQWYHNTP